MSIKMYCGILGSGKTYEVVSEVILGARRQGRRVVSNIAGLNDEVMRAILIEEGTPAGLIGELVRVEHDKVKEAIFWRTDTDDKTGRVPFINKGDVVCLDEIWRFYDGFGARDSDGKKLPEECKNFFRMHRQFPDPVTGLTCEIALITQDPADASRFVKGVVEQVFYMTKLTAVGMHNRYRVDIYAKKITRNPIRSLQRSYNEKYFPCYKSHSQSEEGGAKVVERSADDRGNVLKGALFKVGLPLAGLLLVSGAFFTWRFFHPKQEAADVVQVQSGSQAAPVSQSQSVVQSRPVIVVDWRVVGWYSNGAMITATLQNSSGAIRTIANPPVYKMSASGLELELPEGGFATPWTQTKSRGVLP
jgi:zona occludens toxin